MSSTSTSSDIEEGSVTVSADAIYIKYGLLRFDKDFIFQSLSHVFQRNTTNEIVGITHIELTSNLSSANEDISNELNIETVNDVYIGFDNLQKYIVNDHKE